MNPQEIAEAYRQRTVPELEALAKDLARLTPESIPLLQAELLRREAWEPAMEITRTLAQRKFISDDSGLIEAYVTLLHQTQSSDEAANHIQSQFGIEAAYLELLRKKIRVEARDHLILGTSLFIIPTSVTVFLLMQGLFGGILPLVLSVFGMVRIYKGARQFRALRIR